jgi:methionyl-tRNA synthetase
MVARYNSDLANNFGNLASRVLNMAIKYCDGVSPNARANGPLKDLIGKTFDEANAYIADFNFSEAQAVIWKLIGETNAYIETTEPFKLAKEDITKAQEVLGDCLESLRAVCLMAYPTMPDTCTELWRRLGLSDVQPIEKCVLPGAIEWGSYPEGLPLEKGESLFPRIDAETNSSSPRIDSETSS